MLCGYTRLKLATRLMVGQLKDEMNRFETILYTSATARYARSEACRQDMTQAVVGRALVDYYVMSDVMLVRKHASRLVPRIQRVAFTVIESITLKFPMLPSPTPLGCIQCYILTT